VNLDEILSSLVVLVMRSVVWLLWLVPYEVRGFFVHALCSL